MEEEQQSLWKPEVRVMQRDGYLLDPEPHGPEDIATGMFWESCGFVSIYSESQPLGGCAKEKAECRTRYRIRGRVARSA